MRYKYLNEVLLNWGDPDENIQDNGIISSKDIKRQISSYPLYMNPHAPRFDIYKDEHIKNIIHYIANLINSTGYFSCDPESLYDQTEWRTWDMRKDISDPENQEYVEIFREYINKNHFMIPKDYRLISEEYEENEKDTIMGRNFEISPWIPWDADDPNMRNKKWESKFKELLELFNNNENIVHGDQVIDLWKDYIMHIFIWREPVNKDCQYLYFALWEPTDVDADIPENISFIYREDTGK